MNIAHYKDRFQNWLFTPPGAIIGGVIAISAVDAARRAWRSSEFLADFFLWWLAGIVYIPFLVAPFAGGIYFGIKVAKRTGTKWLGWLLGIAVGIVLTWVITSAAQAIPGIGWRLDVFLSSGDD